MLEARQVALKQHQHWRIRDVSLTVHPGEMVVILGPNGAGKSSLLHVLSGLVTPTQGDVWLADQPLYAQSAAWQASHRAVMEQALVTPMLWRCEDLVASGGYWADQAAEAAFAQAVSLTHTQPLLSRLLHTLSGGERQRVHLARALCQLLASSHSERYLLLDEPTAALDFAMADALMANVLQLCRLQQIGVVATVHDLNLALRYADQVLLLSQSQAVAFGTCEKVMQKRLLESVYGIELIELTDESSQRRAFIPKHLV